MRTLLLSALVFVATSAWTQPFTQVFAAQDVNAQYQAVAVDGGRNVYIAGIDNGDFFALRLDQNGSEIWSTTLPVANIAGVDSLVIDSDGNIHMAGRTDLVAGVGKMFVASFSRVDGSVRFSKSFPNIAGVPRLAAGKSGNSALLFATATFAGNATGNDVLALRLSPASGNEIWRRQIDGGAAQDDVAVNIVTNSAGAPFLNARLKRTAGTAGVVLRLSGTDGSTVFQRDIGVGATFNGVVPIKGTNNIGFLGSPGGSNSAVLALINGSTGAVIRQSFIGAAPVGAFSASNGDMMAGLVIPDGYVVRMDGTTGIYSTTLSNQIQNLLCCDLNDQVFNAPQIVQGGGIFTRLPSGNSFTLTFLPRTAVVDNQNNLILIGASSGVSHVLKLKQGLTTRDDRFTAQFTNELTVDAPGVLSNDSAFGATITLDQPPINGSVVLNQDGSFVYTPDAGFNGGDFFRYEVEFQGERSSARVDISRTAFQTVTLSPVSVIGGEPSIGTLTMSLKPTVGIEALVSDNSTAVTTPASVVLSTLDKTTPFSLTTVPVSATFNATVTVTVSGITKQKTLQVKVGGLKALTLTGSTNVVAGDSRTVKVELTGVAEANTTVALTGTGPEASFPGSLIVPAGFSSKAFTIGIAQRTTPASFTLSAKLFDTTKTLTIAIEPMPKIVTLAAPDVVVGGLNVPLTVTLDKVTPFFLPVSLVLTQNPSSIATLPNSSIIFAGQSSAVFQVQTNVTLFTKVFTVQASVGGATKTRNVQVIRNPLESITAAPSPVIGGQPLAVTVNLSNLAPAGGITVALSSNSQLISVPATVFVPAGSWAATVPATTKSVVFQGRVTLTATLSNVTRTVQVTISP